MPSGLGEGKEEGPSVPILAGVSGSSEPRSAISCDTFENSIDNHPAEPARRFQCAIIPISVMKAKISARQFAIVGKVVESWIAEAVGRMAEGQIVEALG